MKSIARKDYTEIRNTEKVGKSQRLQKLKINNTIALYPHKYKQI